MSNAYASWERIVQVDVFEQVKCSAQKFAKAAQAPGVNFLKHPWASDSRKLPHEYRQGPVPSWVMGDFSRCIGFDTHFPSAERQPLGPYPERYSNSYVFPADG